MSSPKEISENEDICAVADENVLQSAPSCRLPSKLLSPYNIYSSVGQPDSEMCVSGYIIKDNTPQSEVQSNIHTKSKNYLDSGGTCSCTQPSSKTIKKRTFISNLSSVSSSLLQRFEDVVGPGSLILTFSMMKLFMAVGFLLYYDIDGC